MSEQIYSQEEIFAAVLPLLKKYHAERAILFGSYARKEAGATSDIDLIVVRGRRIRPDGCALYRRGTALRFGETCRCLRVAGARSKVGLL